MRTTIIAIAVAVTVVALPTTTQAQPAQQPTSHWVRHGCEKPVRVATYRNQVRRVFRYSDTGGDFRANDARYGRPRLKRMRSCALTEAAHEVMNRLTRERVRAWLWHREIDQITPYGKWAIPPYIVMCESGGSWSAYNPSGASGPYQLLGWGAPMPANTPERQAAHHRIAAHVWRVQGAGAWVCR